jgi:hypothetical protein
MIYIKSTLVGLAALFVATIVYIVSLTSILLRRYPPPPGVQVGFDLGGLVYRPSYWLIALVAFALGFYWELRRVTT